MAQTRKWALRALTVVAVLLFVAVAVEKAIWHGPYDEIRDALWQIELDSSMDEVSVSVPFDPIRTEEHSDTRSGRPEVVWYYEHHPVAAVIPSVVFDKESSSVVAVYVDDTRHRFSPAYLGDLQ
jgi:hypothetical protein